MYGIGRGGIRLWYYTRRMRTEQCCDGSDGNKGKNEKSGKVRGGGFSLHYVTFNKEEEEKEQHRKCLQDKEFGKEHYDRQIIILEYLLRNEAYIK